jgi:peptidyl-Lys metalloendopeptidase
MSKEVPGKIVSKFSNQQSNHSTIRRFSMKRFVNTVSFAIVLALVFNLTGVFIQTANARSNSLSSLSNAVVSLNADKTSFGESEAVMVHVKISNPNSQPLRILNWHTPANGVQESLFIITQNGNSAAYIGPLYKRAAPSDADYLVLDPGASLEYDVNLSDSYAFAESGDYEIAYDTAASNLYTDEASAKIAGHIKSGSLRLSVEGRANPVRKVQPIDAISGSNSFAGCNASQQIDLVTARDDSSTYANDALAYFTSNKAGDRYQKWFGVIEATRWNLVKSHFTSIAYFADTAALTFDCTCTSPGTYAYVYSNDPSRMYLCGAFWAAPAIGTDSKAGTLIHEMSHYTILGGTDDYVYGQSGAMNLAITSPAQAVMNADNHEYFAENTPTIVDNEVFGDVADTYWAWSFIEKLYNNGITGGCLTSPLLYCPGNTVTRAEMAVFLEKGIHGTGFNPGNLSPTFGDTMGHWAEDWIEALKNDGITSGCAAGLYCPNSSVTRGQMAVFLLKAKYGAAYQAPDVAPTFNDTAGHWAENWIEQLALENITSGCGSGAYCPENAVTRAEMAVFLVKTFNLP